MPSALTFALRLATFGLHGRLVGDPGRPRVATRRQCVGTLWHCARTLRQCVKTLGAEAALGPKKVLTWHHTTPIFYSKRSNLIGKMLRPCVYGWCPAIYTPVENKTFTMIFYICALHMHAGGVAIGIWIFCNDTVFHCFFRRFVVAARIDVLAEPSSDQIHIPLGSAA